MAQRIRTHGITNRADGGRVVAHDTDEGFVVVIRTLAEATLPITRNEKNPEKGALHTRYT